MGDHGPFTLMSSADFPIYRECQSQTRCQHQARRSGSGSTWYAQLQHQTINRSSACHVIGGPGPH